MSIKFYFLSLRAFTHTSFLSLSTLNTSDSSPGGGEYSWEFLLGLCLLVIRTLTLFQTKKCHFHTHFQTWRWSQNTTYVFTLTEIMSPLLNLGRQQKMSFFLSFSFIIEITNTFIHYRGSFVNHTRFQTKMGKTSTLFQTKTAPKPYLLGLHIPIWPIIREPPPSSLGPKPSYLLVSPC